MLDIYIGYLEKQYTVHPKITNHFKRTNMKYLDFYNSLAAKNQQAAKSQDGESEKEGRASSRGSQFSS